MAGQILLTFKVEFPVDRDSHFCFQYLGSLLSDPKQRRNKTS